jgi:hypothetical protein
VLFLVKIQNEALTFTSSFPSKDTAPSFPSRDTASSLNRRVRRCSLLLLRSAWIQHKNFNTRQRRFWTMEHAKIFLNICEQKRRIRDEQKDPVNLEKILSDIEAVYKVVLGDSSTKRLSKNAKARLRSFLAIDALLAACQHETASSKTKPEAAAAAAAAALAAAAARKGPEVEPHPPSPTVRVRAGQSRSDGFGSGRGYREREREPGEGEGEGEARPPTPTVQTRHVHRTATSTAILFAPLRPLPPPLLSSLPSPSLPSLPSLLPSLSPSSSLSLPLSLPPSLPTNHALRGAVGRYCADIACV